MRSTDISTFDILLFGCNSRELLRFPQASTGTALNGLWILWENTRKQLDIHMTVTISNDIHMSLWTRKPIGASALPSFFTNPQQSTTTAVNK